MKTSAVTKDNQKIRQRMLTRKRLNRPKKVVVEFFVPGIERLLVVFRGKASPRCCAAGRDETSFRDNKLKSFPYDPSCRLFDDFR